ncbi:hypothetical protein MTO96_038830 [Rhipicephalus appendiculatus]
MRCLIEGEEVLNAEHVLCFGVRTASETSCVVQGLCLQRTHVRSDPHEAWFELKDDGTIKAHCKCAAGNSMRCKHVVALLLAANRTGLDKLELLTSTDMKQVWGKMKSTGYFKPKKIRDLCHVKAKPRLRLGSGALQEIRQQLIAAAPESALARHSRGRFDDVEEKENIDINAELDLPESCLIVEHMIFGRGT